jgi:hypothetical protein
MGMLGINDWQLNEKSCKACLYMIPAYFGTPGRRGTTSAGCVGTTSSALTFWFDAQMRYN